MSYILDALRRSQAERERGQVPGLHAQPTPAEAPPPLRRGAPALGLGLGLGLVGLAALAVWWQWPAPTAVVAVASAPVPAAQAVPPAPLPQVVSVPPVVAAPAPVPAPVVAPVIAAPAAAPAPRSLTLAELTPEQRRELPPLVMGGSIWSENVQSRFVIVNGQVVREGEAAGPGVTVERIAQKAVLLRWRELRFEVPL